MTDKYIKDGPDLGYCNGNDPHDPYAPLCRNHKFLKNNKILEILIKYGGDQYLKEMQRLIQGSLLNVSSTVEREISNRWKIPLNFVQFAAFHGRYEMFMYLLEIVDTLNDSYDSLTRLHCAAYGGNLEIVRYLVERGDPIDQLSKIGFEPTQSQQHDVKVTALIFASKAGHPDVVNYLLKNGADYTIRGTGIDGNIMNAAEFAEKYGKKNVMECFNSLANSNQTSQAQVLVNQVKSPKAIAPTTESNPSNELVSGKYFIVKYNNIKKRINDVTSYSDLCFKIKSRHSITGDIKLKSESDDCDIMDEADFNALQNSSNILCTTNTTMSYI